MEPDAPWPRPGEVTAIVATAVSPAATPSAPSIRAIVLNPGRYLDQKVSITGQFSGRNLLGELPDAPGKSRYDFVLRSADAALWVINMRPRMKDASGKDLELGLDARIDTGRWLTVRGTIQQGRGLQWLDAEAGSLALAKPRDRHDARRGSRPRTGGTAAGSDLQRADRGRNRRVDGDDGPDSVFAGHRSGHAEEPHPRALSGVAEHRAAVNRRRRGFHVPVLRRQPRAGAQVHEAARALPDVEGRSARGHRRHRWSAAEALDADVRRRLVGF